MITIDVKELFLILLILAAIVLLLILCVMIINLTKTLKQLNVILSDTRIITAIASEKAQETKPVLDDLSGAILNFANAAKGNESRIASLSTIGKSIASLVSMLKRGRSRGL